MIYSDSRYADGNVFKAQDARTGSGRLTVYRKFPTESSSFSHYTWIEGDRVDAVAHDLMGSGLLWWRLMDYNPEIVDPFDIPVGTVIRVPRG